MLTGTLHTIHRWGCISGRLRTELVRSLDRCSGLFDGRADASGEKSLPIPSTTTCHPFRYPGQPERLPWGNFGCCWERACSGHLHGDRDLHGLDRKGPLENEAFEPDAEGGEEYQLPFDSRHGGQSTLRCLPVQVHTSKLKSVLTGHCADRPRDSRRDFQRLEGSHSVRYLGGCWSHSRCAPEAFIARNADCSLTISRLLFSLRSFDRNASHDCGMSSPLLMYIKLIGAYGRRPQISPYQLSEWREKKSSSRGSTPYRI